MSVRFLAENIWKEITDTAEGRRGTAFVAVPYFGQSGTRLLPLRSGDTLLVNASEAAVSSGQTYPRGLRTLLDRGVKIYTLGNLHAKIYVFGAVAFIGSANASSNSSDELEEAVVQVRDVKVVGEARKHIQGLCTTPLLRRDLDRLATKYQPPKRPGGGRQGGKSGAPVKPRKPRLFLAQIEEGEVDTGYDKDFKTGHREAKAKREHSRSIIDAVWRSGLPYRVGDTLIQVLETAGGAMWVYPRAKVINRKVVPRGNRKMTFVYLEFPDQPRQRLATLEKKLPRRHRHRLLKQGPIPEDDFRAKLLELVG
jgi:hypothetical protein